MEQAEQTVDEAVMRYATDFTEGRQQFSSVEELKSAFETLSFQVAYKSGMVGKLADSFKGYLYPTLNNEKQQ